MLGRNAVGVLSVCLLLLCARPLLADSEPLAPEMDLFTIYGIEVDVTATTAAQARRQAMADAQRQAFERLMDKLVASTAQQAVPPAGGSMLNRLVQSVDVFDERSSSTRYLARMDIAFNGDAVRGFLGDAGLAYTESRGGPFLLLPLFDTGVGLQLTGAHPWRTAMGEAEPKNRLVAYRLPANDMKARRLLTARRTALADPRDLSELADAYDMGEAVLARARRGIDPASGRAAVSYSLRTGRFLALEQSGEVIARAGETADELLIRAADAVLRRIDAAWKARTLIAGQDRDRLDTAVPLAGLADWLAVKDRLSRVALLRDIGIEEAGLPVTHLTLDYVGSLEQLRLALEQQRLSLRPAAADAAADFVLQLAEQISPPVEAPPEPEGDPPTTEDEDGTADPDTNSAPPPSSSNDANGGGTRP